MDNLICDIYSADCYGKPDIAALVAAGLPWAGLILKATEGTSYPTQPSSRAWFLKNWPLTKSLAGARYGETWFRGAYLYWRADADPVAQADFYLQLVEEAGGWGDGDLWPMVDVESAGNSNPALSGQQVIDSVSAVTARLHEKLGRTPMLYGGSFMYDLGITSHMGCNTLLFPRYTSTLPAQTYERIGWKLQAEMPTLWGWQYAGDGESYLAGYPSVSPLGGGDISALIVAGGGDAALAWTKANLRS